MFTGIIRNTGVMSQSEPDADGARILQIDADVSNQLSEGDSVAVNGVCLTVLDHTDSSWTARLMQETLTKTTLGELQAGAQLNIELPVAANERMHGHIVQGHVDGTCIITAITPAGDDKIITLKPSQEVLQNITKKGSVALDGVSLTVADVLDDSFTVSVMPYTLTHTTLGAYAVGDTLNIETDKHTQALWVSGVIEKGDQRGTALGFPTANITLTDTSTPLEEGVFAARAMLAGDPTLYAGALHVGPRPTFPGASASVEMHLLHFSPRDLYGQTMHFSVIEKIRDVQKFDSTDALIEAITNDVAKATEILSTLRIS